MKLLIFVLAALAICQTSAIAGDGTMRTSESDVFCNFDERNISIDIDAITTTASEALSVVPLLNVDSIHLLYLGFDAMTLEMAVATFTISATWRKLDVTEDLPKSEQQRILESFRNLVSGLADLFDALPWPVGEFHPSASHARMWLRLIDLCKMVPVLDGFMTGSIPIFAEEAAVLSDQLVTIVKMIVKNLGQTTRDYL